MRGRSLSDGVDRWQRCGAEIAQLVRTPRAVRAAERGRQSVRHTLARFSSLYAQTVQPCSRYVGANYRRRPNSGRSAPQRSYAWRSRGLVTVLRRVGHFGRAANTVRARGVRRPAGLLAAGVRQAANVGRA